MGKETNRTVSLALVCTGLGLATATWVARGRADRTQLEVTADRLRSLREMHGRHLADSVKTLLDSTGVLASDPGVVDALSGGEAPNQNLLVEAARSLGAWSSILIHADGRIAWDTELHGEQASGPLADGLERLSQLTHRGSILADFGAYAPRDGAPRAFTMAGVWAAGPDGQQQRIGALALEHDPSRLNALLTGGGRWREEGLGETGEVYLVGSDLLMRTESRFLAEDREAYAESLERAQTPEDVMERILSTNSSILLQTVDTAAVHQALDGVTDTQIIDDYRGVSVLSSFAPFRAGGARLALVAEMDVDEVRNAGSRIARDVLLPGLGLLSLIGVCAYVFGSRRTRSLRRVRERAYGLATLAGADADVPQVVDDELRACGVALNALSGAVVESQRRSNFYRAVFDADPSPVLVCAYPQVAARTGRDNPRLLESSSAGLEILGLQPAEIARMRLGDVITVPGDSDAGEHSNPWLDDLRDEGAIEDVGVELITADRRRLPALLEATVSVEGPEENWFLVLVARLEED